MRGSKEVLFILIIIVAMFAFVGAQNLSDIFNETNQTESSNHKTSQ